MDRRPSAVPTGTDQYYRERSADFERRCPGAPPPAYYEKYGHKCLHQFRRTEPELTEAGQRWLNRTLVDLQERMEARRSEGPMEFAELEHDSDAFQEMAFGMHAEAYLSCGISELPSNDLIKIALTPDAADLLTTKGLDEILEVVGGVTAAKRRTGGVRKAAGRIVDLVRMLARRGRT